MTSADIEKDRKDGTPERIWASPEHPDENRHGFWIAQKVAPSVEYIRGDIHAARIAALEARVKELEAEYTDAVSGLDYVRFHYGDLHGVSFDRVRETFDRLIGDKP